MTRLFYVASLFLLLALLPGCGSGSGGVKATGTLINPDPTNSRFTINPLTEWEGFVPNGTSVDVATADKTTFFDEQGAAMTSQSFYNLVTTSAQPRAFRVHVEGSGGASLINADLVHLIQ